MAAATRTGANRVDSGLPGSFFHIELRRKAEFAKFRTYDLSEGVQRVEGERADGSSDTQEWLISKREAHVEGGRLVADTEDARKILDDLDSVPEQVEGDRFTARPRRSPARFPAKAIIKPPKINLAKGRAAKKK